MIRILIVDDSPTARLLLRMLFELDSGLVVVGEARSGREALTRCVELQPDIVTMDINMPGMDGYEAIRLIMSESPRPIVVLTAAGGAYPAGGAVPSADGAAPSTNTDTLFDISFKAIELGALSVLEKPTLHDRPGSGNNAETLINEIKTMAGVKVVSRPLWLQKRAGGAPPRSTAPMLLRERPAIIGMGVSTGGPPALQTILAGLTTAPASGGGTVNAPIVIVQHMSRGFIAGLASWLAQTTRIPCQVVEDGQILLAGAAYLAPDDRHLVIRRGGIAALDNGGAVDGHRPSVTALFESLALSYGPRAVGVQLTGMGQDGARGLLAMRNAGAYTIAQDESSSVVYGMPKVAVEMGAAMETLPIELIAERLMILTQILRC